MKNIIAILLLLSIIPGALASSHCSELYDSASVAIDYAAAGECFMERGEWGECSLSYLKATKLSQEDWDFGAGVFSNKALALQYTVQPGIIECYSNYDDGSLATIAKSYNDWLTFYQSNPVESPVDLEQITLELESTFFPAEPEPEPELFEEEVVEEQEGVVEKQPVKQEVTQGEKKEDGLPLIPIIVVLGIAGGAYYFFTTKGKKAKE